jgi:hypothetical protein
MLDVEMLATQGSDFPLVVNAQCLNAMPVCKVVIYVRKRNNREDCIKQDSKGYAARRKLRDQPATDSVLATNRG